MSKITFVYFDLGDVLFNWRNVLNNEFVTMSKKSPEKVWAAFTRHDDDACRGKITAQKLWEYLKTELGIKDDINNFVEWWASGFSPIPLMHQLVEMTSKKYKVGILTNIYLEAWKHYAAHGLIPDVSYGAIVQSCEIGFMKPDIEIYKYAESKAGVSPQEILLIDNSRENIDKATELGWQTVWYDVTNPQKSIAEIKQVLELN